MRDAAVPIPVMTRVILLEDVATGYRKRMPVGADFPTEIKEIAFQGKTWRVIGEPAE